ncbi:bifunctional adenosylcobinamide kinase/adenosylcobinamide-phosphate guanylyltransferase [Thermoanaerobacterium sp. PSU-2]|uniref:bifunctional adenosylcobinamide kinase/adenosylcobinamide-phosphate guanylyltransferase n=1 Tax=Thermoanaerobacterium sp. PSU-2 TaxID=1930849 RepID=UPI000A167ECF|nr:bifunctional adenosylcobinamide kinase/adenosylcobinamide-phosphate guanylyltransferase [Thermoanaerobacterium sp. PSU-2]ORX24597.1 bifunctional adenosylcobinamide kinase/adenosylcobinamide-phosphate guanylyltransferase [Thermoanaerobacterium sp. PSU-2]HHV73224.1 bifunctional adenosylcobinamide kinase/adenosylcobinamide-phosphate guanylyltransferase [Thermoanaerobacterium sp.]
MDLIMVTGGARSGKSQFAESLAVKYAGNSVLYIATSIPFDDEMKERVRRHRERRPKEWETVEAYKGIFDIIRSTDKKAVLLDCLTVMVSNLLLEIDMTWEEKDLEDVVRAEEKISREVDGFIKASKEKDKDVIVVTNEVGMGLVPEYKLGRIFRDISGRMNKKIAENADYVYFMVSGIPLEIKNNSLR